jgi:hypothetical protein
MLASRLGDESVGYDVFSPAPHSADLTPASGENLLEMMQSPLTSSPWQFCERRQYCDGDTVTEDEILLFVVEEVADSPPREEPESGRGRGRGRKGEPLPVQSAVETGREDRIRRWGAADTAQSQHGQSIEQGNRGRATAQPRYLVKIVKSQSPKVANCKNSGKLAVEPPCLYRYVRFQPPARIFPKLRMQRL